MGFPYFKVRWHKVGRPRAVEILPSRGWNFTHPCNGWMKRGPVWVCGRQSSKARGVPFQGSSQFLRKVQGRGSPQVGL